MTTEIPQLSDRTGYRLIKLGELVMRLAEDALAPLGVKPRQFNVLATLAANQTWSQQDISRALGVDPNVMVGVVDELERLALARRRRSTQDRRRHVLVLTDEGRAVLRDGSAAIDRAERALLADVGPADVRTLHDVAGRLLQSAPAARTD